MTILSIWVTFNVTSDLKYATLKVLFSLLRFVETFPSYVFECYSIEANDGVKVKFWVGLKFDLHRLYKSASIK
jgi:hypothetical protein